LHLKDRHQARRRVVRIEKPWGWEILWAHTDRYAGKILHIKRGAALSYQFHCDKDETIYLLRGMLDLEFARASGRRRRHRVRPGEAFRIRPGDRHRMIAVSACDVLEASTPELEDVVRLEDRYGRVDGQGAEARRQRRLMVRKPRGQRE
jgi:mannose-6-phosphate isomerase-like protein (cupin superfamily)